jgi:hypothetical protein
MMRDFVSRGGALYACTPCVKARGSEQTDLIDGVTIAGASVIHERFKRGAASLRTAGRQTGSKSQARIANVEETKIDRETMGRLAKALAFIGSPDDPVVIALRLAAETGTDRDKACRE